MSDKELSADDLREKLFHSFRNRGVIDSLKSQLRNRLVLELQQTAKINLSNGREKSSEQLSLFHQAANSLVVHHLEQSNLEYTLSVFLPESGTPKDKVLTVKDILHLLKIDPESTLYKSLDSPLSRKNNTKSFLLEFISQISHLCPHSKQTVSSQTDNGVFFMKSSIDEKLRSVDKVFSERAERENEAWSSQAEQKILSFQRQCEERKKTELEMEIERFRTTELARMRLEEREKFQKELSSLRDQLETDYSLKAEVLRVKEKETMERLQRQQQMQEEEAYTQRQKLLEEMQAIRERENDIKRRQELDLKSVQLEEERVKGEADRVRQLQESLKDQETRSQQRIDDEVQRFKLKFQEEFQRRTHDLELREAQFRHDKDSFDKSKTTYMGYFDQLEKKKEELRHLQSQLEREKYTAATLAQQKQTLTHQLDEFKDYRVVKEREQSLQREVDSLQRELDDLRAKEKASKKSMKELNDKLSKPSSEMIALREEVKTLKDDAKNKERLHKDRQKKMEAVIQAENQRCVQYQRLYEEHMLRQKEMERELDDLRSALHHTQNVLRMELDRRRMSETSISDMTDLPTPSTVPVPTSAITTPAITHAHSRDVPDDDVMDGTSNTVDMIAQSKDVYDKLEREARELEESFRRFQSRMKNTGQFTMVLPVSGNDIPRYPTTQPSGVPPSVTMRTNKTKTETPHNFVQLSWVPTTDHEPYKSAYMASQPVTHLQNTRPFTRQDGGNGTRFYTLPSFGVSNLTGNTSQDRYSSLPPDTRRPNNTVNVSDLIAKPGSPSVISAPIDHSPLENTSKDTIKTHRGTDKQTDNSTDTERRPLSSTIDRQTDETGAESRDTGVMTSRTAPRMSAQSLYVPSTHPGIIYEKSEANAEDDGELDDSDSRRSSEISQKSGALSIGTLNKSANNRKGRIYEPEPGAVGGNLGDGSAHWESQPNRDSMDSVWGKTKLDDSVFLKSQTAIQDETTNQRSRISLDNTWGKDQSDSVFLKSQTEIQNLTEDNRTQASLDGAWGQQKHDSSFHRESQDDSEKEVSRENVKRPQMSLDSAWGQSNDSVFVHEKEQSLDEESSASFKSDPSLPGMEGSGGRGGLTVSLDNTWRSSAQQESDLEMQQREKHEREIREREDREWEEQKRRREEERKKREQEAREREQRELQALQREEEERNESRKQDEPEKPVEPDRQEMEPESKEPEIDPVMLQYMQMIQRRKEDEGKEAKDPQISKNRTSSKEVIHTPSNSEISQADDNLGSIDEISGDEGFDWG